MKNYSFYQNRECEYFPCHKGIAEEEFNCLFCYCPLFALGEKCGGDFERGRDGIKICSGCVFPHKKDNYEEMISRVKKVVEKTRV